MLQNLEHDIDRKGCTTGCDICESPEIDSFNCTHAESPEMTVLSFLPDIPMIEPPELVRFPFFCNTSLYYLPDSTSTW